MLIPGAISTSPNAMNTSGRYQGSGSRPQVNGNREQTNNFLLDGVDNNDSIDNRIGYQPNVDALEEVSVITGNGSSEFGNVGGAIVNTTLRAARTSFTATFSSFCAMTSWMPTDSLPIAQATRSAPCAAISSAALSAVR